MATVESESVLVFGPADDGRAVTAEEYLRAEVQSGYQCELARGVLEVTYIPAEPHAMLVHFFFKALTRYEDAHPDRIYLFGGSNEFHIWLTELPSGRNPDVAMALRGAPRDEFGHAMASLAIEIVSPGKKARDRDYVAKREEYLAYGLRESWIVDRFLRRVTVLVREGEAWTERTFTEGQAAEGLVLPGFVLAVDDLWAAIEDVEEANGNP